MDSIQIYLTSKERDVLLDVLNDYLDLSSGWSIEANEQLTDKMNNGLGKVMFKLYKGLNGEDCYKEYNNKIWQSSWNRQAIIVIKGRW